MKTVNSKNEVKPSLETRIENLRNKELEKYNNMLKTQVKYKIQDGFTNFVSGIIATCRGGFF